MDNKKKSESIIDYLDKRPAIAITRLEAEAGIPKYTIHWAKQKKSRIPDKHIDNIVKVLRRYGYQD